MRRTCLSIFVLVLAMGCQPLQEASVSAPDRTRGVPLYTYDPADYRSDIAAAKTAATRLEAKGKRWEAIKLAVAHAHVVTDIAFHDSMSLWTNNFLGTGGWTVSADGDLTRAVRQDAEATVLVHGDCLQPVHVTNGALIHVLGDLSAEIRVQGHCEVLIGGDIRKSGNIRGDGIVRIFVGGDVHGSIQNAGSSTVWIAGSLKGKVATGTPSTNLHVMGDITGEIAPMEEAALLSLEARGYVPGRVLDQTARRRYTQFQATIGSSDRPADLYANGTDTWVIHEQR